MLHHVNFNVFPKFQDEHLWTLSYCTCHNVSFSAWTLWWINNWYYFHVDYYMCVNKKTNSKILYKSWKDLLVANTNVNKWNKVRFVCPIKHQTSSIPPMIPNNFPHLWPIGIIFGTIPEKYKQKFGIIPGIIPKEPKFGSNFGMFFGITMATHGNKTNKCWLLGDFTFNTSYVYVTLQFPV